MVVCNTSLIDATNKLSKPLWRPTRIKGLEEGSVRDRVKRGFQIHEAGIQRSVPCFRQRCEVLDDQHRVSGRSARAETKLAVVEDVAGLQRSSQALIDE